MLVRSLLPCALPITAPVAISKNSTRSFSSTSSTSTSTDTDATTGFDSSSIDLNSSVSSAIGIKKKNIEEILLEPHTYLHTNSLGKNIFSKLVNALNLWLKVPEKKFSVVCKLTDMLYYMLLMIDDIQDNSPIRYGVPSAHVVFGIPQTINSANYVFLLVLEEVRKLNNQEAMAMLSMEMRNLYRGQAMDIHCRDTVTCPTEEEYFKVTLNKSTGFTRMLAGIMQAESSSKINCISLVHKIGVYHQVMDDYLSLQSQQNTKDKGTFCEDIEDGNFSFPIIHSIQTNPQNQEILTTILKQRTTSVELKQYTLDILESTNTFNYCREYLQNLENEIRQEIQNLGGNELLEKLVDATSVYRVT